MAKKSKSMQGFLQLQEDTRKGEVALQELLLKPEHTTGSVVREDELDEQCLWPLVIQGILQKIVEGWYYVSDPSSPEWERPVYWDIAYWHFVPSFLDREYGDSWCLSADDSLMFMSENGVIPFNLTVRAEGVQTHVVRLPAGKELLVVGASLPKFVEREKRFGVRLYQLSHALLAASPGFCLVHPIEARTCLALLRDTEDVARVALEEKLATGAAKVAGGLMSIGFPIMAENLLIRLENGNMKVEPDNPFQKDVTLNLYESAISSRMRLMWMCMRERVLREDVSGRRITKAWTPSEVNDIMDKAFLKDAASTLCLQEMNVTEALARSVVEGKWEYEVLCQEAGEENVAATMGYLEAYRLARTDILDSLSGGCEPQKLFERIRGWYTALMQPFKDHGLLEDESYRFYRRKEGFVIGSDHIPVGADEVPAAMDTLEELLAGERKPFVRAVLGAFFLEYIQPVHKVTGVLARLYLNSQLVCHGLPWITVGEEDRSDYQRSVEEGSVNLFIRNFANLIAKQIETATVEMSKSC